IRKLRAVPHVAAGRMQAKQVEAAIKIQRRRIFVKTGHYNHVAGSILLLNRQRQIPRRQTPSSPPARHLLRQRGPAGGAASSPRHTRGTLPKSRTTATGTLPSPA